MSDTLPSHQVTARAGTRGPLLSFRSLCWLEVALCAPFVVPLLLIPVPMMGLFGMGPDASAAVFLRCFGTGILFVALLSYLLRGVGDATVQRAYTLSNVAQDTLLGGVTLLGTLEGHLNWLGWVLTGLFLAVAAVNAACIPPTGVRS